MNAIKKYSEAMVLRFAVLFLLFSLAGTLHAIGEPNDAVKIKMSLHKYMKKRDQSVSPEAFSRCVERMRNVKIGMRSDQFFDTMEMHLLTNRSGEVVEGFVEGYLQPESRLMNETKGSDRYLIFGYYENWKEMKGPRQKFYVVFRNLVLSEVGRLDMTDTSLAEVFQPSDAATQQTLLANVLIGMAPTGSSTR